MLVSSFKDKSWFDASFGSLSGCLFDDSGFRVSDCVADCGAKMQIITFCTFGEFRHNHWSVSMCLWGLWNSCWTRVHVTDDVILVIKSSPLVDIFRSVKTKLSWNERERDRNRMTPKLDPDYSPIQGFCSWNHGLNRLTGLKVWCIKVSVVCIPMLIW